ncbi:hypothetical protein [Xanthomonas sacchari]|uniref:hypothetical protein n=1 Tax=Xanthomonas sacchari TaxID=56458 RepID=UPI00225DEACE|nr:hypothetical protein [Xanthomonas sacchari]
MFIEREPNEVIFYTAGELIQHTIIDGDKLTLRSRAGEDILVRDVKVLGHDRYSGTIYGFEPSRAIEHAGLRLEQLVDFHESNIFGVRRA